MNTAFHEKFLFPVLTAMAAAWLFVATPVQAQSNRGQYGNFTLGAGFLPDPQTATGMSGGGRNSMNARNIYGENCRGIIDTVPDHQITVTSTVSLKIKVTSATDTTLVVTGPGGTFCDDDSGGALNPELTGRFIPGVYQVYVGIYDNGVQATNYELTIREHF